MPKIMLVEDDNNLREIYEARLLAEGYEIVSAKDGEEALALAVKEKPDLIISDVMMPKISGFDMLDILRSTPETKDTKVVMMTALSQAEDKSRADKLGADRYLVKSQVTLEDVARVAREVLSGEEAPAAPTAAAAPTTPVIPSVADTPVAAPPQAAAADEPSTTPSAIPTSPSPPSTLAEPTEEESAEVNKEIDNFVAGSTPEDILAEAAKTEPKATEEPPAAAAQDQAVTAPSAAADPPQEPPTIKSISTATAPAQIEPAANPEAAPNDAVTVAGKKVLNPINDLSAKSPDIAALLEKEKTNEALAAGNPVAPPPADTVIEPGGKTVTPATKETPPETTEPGNVVHPGGSDPGSIAL